VQRLYRLDPATGELHELEIPEPGDPLVTGGKQELPVRGLEDVRLDEEPRAPDGYEFESSHSGGAGLFGELFSRGDRRARYVVQKHGRRINVPQPNTDAYGYVHVDFIGWAIPIEAGR
jgi:hypothetical protein